MGSLPVALPHGSCPCRLWAWRCRWFEPGNDVQHLIVDPVKILQEHLVLPSAEIIEYGQLAVGFLFFPYSLHVEVDAAVYGGGFKFSCIFLHGIRCEHADHLACFERSDLTGGDKGFELFADGERGLRAVDGQAFSHLFDLSEYPLEPFQGLLVPDRSGEHVADDRGNGCCRFLAVLLLELRQFLQPEQYGGQVGTRLCDQVLDLMGIECRRFINDQSDRPVSSGVNKPRDPVEHDRITGGVDALGIRVIGQYQDRGVPGVADLQVEVLAGKHPEGFFCRQPADENLQRTDLSLELVECPCLVGGHEGREQRFKFAVAEQHRKYFL